MQLCGFPETKYAPFTQHDKAEEVLWNSQSRMRIKRSHLNRTDSSRNKS